MEEEVEENEPEVEDKQEKVVKNEENEGQSDDANQKENNQQILVKEENVDKEP